MGTIYIPANGVKEIIIAEGYKVTGEEKSLQVYKADSKYPFGLIAALGLNMPHYGGASRMNVRYERDMPEMEALAQKITQESRVGEIEVVCLSFEFINVLKRSLTSFFK